jgi:hypothetical protein
MSKRRLPGGPIERIGGVGEGDASQQALYVSATWPCSRLGGLDVQEVTDVGDDFQCVRGGEPMSVVDLLTEDAAVVDTVELQQGLVIG